MLPPMCFATNIRFTRHNEYCFCYQSDSYARVVISCKLKKMIERGDWSQARPDEIEEIRSLYEMKFLVVTGSTSGP